MIAGGGESLNAKSDVPAPRATPGSAAKRIAFIDIGRVIAAFVVFYTHIDAHFLREYYGVMAVPRTVNEVFVQPLGLEDQGVGQVAVCIFFLVSGFVVTPIALKLGARRFAVNRFFRVYPLYAAVVLVSALVFWLGWRPLTSPQEPDLTVGALIGNLTLVNFSIRPFGAFAGVAWTLAVEVIFYLLLVAVLPLFRRWIWLAIAVELDFVLLAILLRNQFGDGYSGFASEAAYLLIPIMGQVLWAGWNRKLNHYLAGGYLFAAWLILVYAAEARVDVYYALRPGPVAIALMLFVVGLGTESRLRGNKWWAGLSDRSYSLYLVHGLVALPVMHALNGLVPLPITLIVGIAVALLAVQLAFVTLERPSHNLGRRLSAPRKERRRAGRHARHAQVARPAPVVDPMADTQVIRRLPAATPAARSRRP